MLRRLEDAAQAIAVCDLPLGLGRGRVRAFGPREEIVRTMARAPDLSPDLGPVRPESG